MSETRDPWAILGVDRDASAEEIKKAYRRMARKYHPDMAGEAGKAMYADVDWARTVLTDPKKRKEFMSAGARVTETIIHMTDPTFVKFNDVLSKLSTQRPSTPNPSAGSTMPRPTMPTRPGSGNGAGLNPQRPPSGATPKWPTTTPGGGAAAPQNPTPDAARPGWNKPLTDDDLRRESFNQAQKIIAGTNGRVRAGDSFRHSSGAVYTLRNVMFKKAGDATTYRSSKPLLCRNDRVLGNITLAPGQGLQVATRADCTNFVAEITILSARMLSLQKLRESLNPIAAELRGVLGEHDTVTFETTAGTTVIGVEVVTFKTNGEGRKTAVLCTKDGAILELQPGDPVNTDRYHYADAKVGQLVIANYMALRAVAAAQAKASGRPVAGITTERLNNTARSVLRGLLGE